jgi:integral membrane protein
MFENKKEALRKVGIMEGWSFLILLFIAMPIKYLLGYPIGVKIVGPIHGFLFMWFLYQLYLFHKEYNYGIKFNFVAFLAALIPFGTFYLDKKLV